ncbi:MAG: RluA family pseudouridine synthase [Archangiaceae bacterium]|nr:RluA family pseudouridine synthase [Archangiaceae bacterium]
MTELTVDAAEAGERIDLFVGKKLSLSRAKLKALFERDLVRVDGRKAKKGQSVAAGQKISVEVPVEGPRAPVAEEGPLTVLHEDAALVFVDKPSGMPVHPLESNETGTVANRLVARWPSLVDASEDPREAGLVHRLDIETSGVLLAAKSRDGWTKLRAQFSGGEAQAKKLYLALVNGPIADEGDIDLPLVQHKDHVRPALSSDDAARPARSRFTVLQRAGMDALVEVQIFTGVMHQVRAHLAGIGAPIVGDALYGGAPFEGAGRFFLHAASLEVRHPDTGAATRVTSPLPVELTERLKQRGL